ncbi:hypothetical protein [Marinimicrobium sp. C2-29]|uniref:hypothetical protein n=1 Tax=Marinimicrobium sp. C2-29 TaxID=3139825 RepID=UPI003138E8D0
MAEANFQNGVSKCGVGFAKLEKNSLLRILAPSIPETLGGLLQAQLTIVNSKEATQCSLFGGTQSNTSGGCVYAVMRENGCTEVEKVGAVVFERSGKFSVVRSSVVQVQSSDSGL